MSIHFRKSLRVAVGVIALGLAVMPVSSAWAAESSTAFYQELYNRLVHREESFTVDYSGVYSDIYDGNNFDSMLDTVMNMHQNKSSDDFDYLRWNYKRIDFTYSNNPGNGTQFNFEVSYREPTQRLAVVNQNVQSILPSLIGSDDLQTIKNVHDFVVNQIEYDRTMQRYTAYEGLIQNSTVCQGYALLTYKLLTDAGIPCRIVAGYAGERHIWNIVKVGDKWYHLDCTWDDPISSQPILRYDYFLIGTDKLSKDHTIDPQWLGASSMAQYPISSSDFSGEYIAEENNQVMSPERQQEVISRESFRTFLANVLDESFAYQQQNKYIKRICDLYKRIVISAVQDLSDDEFARLTKNEESVDLLFSTAEEHINTTIFNPLVAFLDSPEFAEAGEKRFADYCTRNDVDQMDPEVWEKLSYKLAEQWSDEVMEEKVARVSRENTVQAIEAIKRDLQAKLSHD